MHVYTPPGYEHDDRNYPVLYLLLHGGGDTDDSWPTVGCAGAILDNLIAEHKAVPMIVVMPAGHISSDFQLRTGQNTMDHDNLPAYRWAACKRWTFRFLGRICLRISVCLVPAGFPK